MEVDKTKGSGASKYNGVNLGIIRNSIISYHSCAIVSDVTEMSRIDAVDVFPNVFLWFPAGAKYVSPTILVVWQAVISMTRQAISSSKGDIWWSCSSSCVILLMILMALAMRWLSPGRAPVRRSRRFDSHMQYWRYLGT